MSTDRAQISDSLVVEHIVDPANVKGPDPAQWGPDAKRPAPKKSKSGRAKAEPKIKGPDPDQWGVAQTKEQS